jgi:hypothetical protein
MTIKYGEVRSDGYLFWGYTTKKGKRYESWLKPSVYLRTRLATVLSNAKIRAAQKGVPFDIDLAHLQDIYPKDEVCPALGLKLVWGDAKNRNNSPALDRIIPERGYVVGNVEFISDLANRIKSNATTDEIIRVAEYLKEKRTAHVI